MQQHNPNPNPQISNPVLTLIQTGQTIPRLYLDYTFAYAHPNLNLNLNLAPTGHKLLTLTLTKCQLIVDELHESDDDDDDD